MAFSDLVSGIKDWPARASQRFKTLDAFDRVLDGKIYDHLRFPFNKENDGSSYIRLHERRPSIKYNLAKVIVDQVASLTFGEAHFPDIHCNYTADESSKNPSKRSPTELAISRFVEHFELESLMLDASVKASTGSAAIKLRILPDGRPDFRVIRGKYVYPTWDILDPEKLTSLTWIYDVLGQSLIDYGYTGIDPDKTYWLRIVLTDQFELWFFPLASDKYDRLGDTDETGEQIRWELDSKRSVVHNFGMVPAVWIRKLTGSTESIDGQCVFGDIVDIQIAIDYQLSQMQRGITYSMDPMLVIERGELLSVEGGFGKSKTDDKGNLVRSADNVLDVSNRGKAYLLEMTGAGFESGQKLVTLMRAYAFEVLGGLKTENDKFSVPQSGRAMELERQVLVWLIERARLSDGNRGLVPLLRLLLHGAKNGMIELPDAPEGWNSDLDPHAPIRLAWPNWYAPRGADLFAQVQAYQALGGGSPKVPIQILPLDILQRAAARDLDLSDPGRIVDAMDEINRQNVELRKQAILGNQKDDSGGGEDA